MNKMSRLKKRLLTLLGAISFEIILICNSLTCLRSFSKYDNIVFMTQNYGYPAEMRGMYLLLFGMFLTSSIMLGWAIIKYRGHIYDRYIKNR